MRLSIETIQNTEIIYHFCDVEDDKYQHFRSIFTDTIRGQKWGILAGTDAEYQ